jgi:TonB family protein
MQVPTQGEKGPNSATSEATLGRCLVDGDPATSFLARRARRKAFGASLAIEITFLVLLLTLPFLTGVAQPPIHKILPPQLAFFGDWRAHRPVQPVVAPPTTLHPSAIFDPIAPRPSSGLNANPVIADGPGSLTGPDIPELGVVGDAGEINIGRPQLPVEPPHAAPPPQPVKRPVKLSEGVLAAQLISRVEPRYPTLAIQVHLQGTVHLHAIISRDGRITSLEVVGGHPLLVQAALDAVRQWRYRPTMLDGEPVEVETTISVEFRLQN